MSDDVGPGLDSRHLESLTERVRRSPFHQWAGLRLVSVGDGRAELEMTLEPHHFNPQGIARMEAEHPEVPVFTAALDRDLTDNGYILPGLGDFGDRLFGTEPHLGAPPNP